MLASIVVLSLIVLVVFCLAIALIARISSSLTSLIAGGA
jgi:hypothetical protein